MATFAQIILISACAGLVDCHYLRGMFNKEQKSYDDHHVSETKTIDPDAVVFPYDEDAIVFEKANKNINDAPVDKVGDEYGNTDNYRDEYVPSPLITKVVPENARKKIFTNPIDLEDIEIAKGNVEDGKELVIDAKQDELVLTESIPDNDIKANDTIEKELEYINDNKSTNEIVSDLSSRFGVNGNYMLVPVTANTQSYQPIQTISSMQGNLPSQTHMPINQLNTNAINPQVANGGSNINYATSNVNHPMPTANVATNVGDVQYATPNIGANVLQAPNTGTNIGSQYVAPNYGNYNQANAPVNANTYVPVNVPNTYLINGQLYAAITVPSNMNVPSTLYYVNPQVPSFQANNVPLYKLVSMSDGGDRVDGNTQLGSNIHAQ